MKYFEDIGSETCYDLEGIKDVIACNGNTEQEVYESRRITGEGFFYCKHFGEVGETGEGCGKSCKAYMPRNGKSGRCIHSGYCYEPTKKVLIKL